MPRKKKFYRVSVTFEMPIIAFNKEIALDLAKDHYLDEASNRSLVSFNVTCPKDLPKDKEWLNSIPWGLDKGDDRTLRQLRSDGTIR